MNRALLAAVTTLSMACATTPAAPYRMVVDGAVASSEERILEALTSLGYKAEVIQPGSSLGTVREIDDEHVSSSGMRPGAGPVDFAELVVVRRFVIRHASGPKGMQLAVDVAAQLCNRNAVEGGTFGGCNSIDEPSEHQLQDRDLFADKLRAALGGKRLVPAPPK